MEEPQLGSLLGGVRAVRVDGYEARTRALMTYRNWHSAQVETDDIDPAYPVLRAYAEHNALDGDARAWLCVCHTVYYQLGATVAMFERFPEAGALPNTAHGIGESGLLLELPCTTERRAHRDKAQLIKHLLSLQELMYEGAAEWLQVDGVGWPALNRRIMEVHGNGRWAAYKLAELLQKVAGVETVATDAGHAHSSGPRKGLDDLFVGLPTGQTGAAVAELDRVTEHLASWIGEPDIALVETSLCDFHSLSKGGYYLGHDIDGMMDQLAHPKVTENADVSQLWAARSVAFAPERLGEFGGWHGVRKPLKRLYKDSGLFDPEWEDVL